MSTLHDVEQEIIDEVAEEIRELKGWSIKGAATFEERLVWLEDRANALFQHAYHLQQKYKHEKRLRQAGKEVSS